ncbi:hypothetical protein [Cytophaga aurantiaca]|nr:hypothetical protein [Cytophaga aurantiaca]
MAITKNTTTPSKKSAGKGSLTEAKTNEDFNKKAPQKDDPQLKIKTVKK